jgi:polyphosphate kinase 2 (PPK2 family)
LAWLEGARRQLGRKRAKSAAASCPGRRRVEPWKLAPIDIASPDTWDDDTRSKGAMFFHIGTTDSRRIVTPGDCSTRAGLNAMCSLLHSLP